MRLLLLMSSFLLALAGGGAASELDAPPPGTTSSPPTVTTQTTKARAKPNDGKSPAEVRKLSAEYLAQCMQDWDSATHMTKQEWARTCRRVVEGRAKFLLELRK